MISIDCNDSPPDSSEDNSKPLMILFKRVIDNKQSMVTNAQILNILQTDFQMDLAYIHELEKDIYLQSMKKFLNDWPRWDEFEKSASSLKENENTQADKLAHYYVDLKTYLSKKLCDIKEPIKEAIKDVPTRKEVANYDKDVVLEIRCTRSQLNELIFRRPHPSFNNTIFNIPGAPTKITVCGSRTTASIINWPTISITVNVKHISFKRTLNPILKHKLINRKLNEVKPPPEMLNTNIQMKEMRTTSEHFKKEFLNELKDVSSFSSDCEEFLFNTLRDTIINDLRTTPSMPLPAMLRKNMPNYPYVRYLFSEVTSSDSSDSNVYDLQLEETIIPQWQLNLRYDSKQCNNLEITIECGECNVSFPGVNALEHFEEMHQGEPNWQCTKCDNTFEAIELSHSGWQHDCLGIKKSDL